MALKRWQTGALVIAVAFAAVAVLGIGWGVIEAVTLADDVPGNHITATWRAYWDAEPGAILLALIVCTNFLTAVLSYIAGHIFWCPAVELKRRIAELEVENEETRASLANLSGI